MASKYDSCTKTNFNGKFHRFNQLLETLISVQKISTKNSTQIEKMFVIKNNRQYKNCSLHLLSYSQETRFSPQTPI